jgi:hypothetical protein
MPDWIIRLLEQWKVVKGAPVPFAIAVLIAAVIVWGAMNWSYSTLLTDKNAQIELQDRQLADLREAVKSGGSIQKSVIQVNSDLYRVQQTDDVIEVFTVPSTIILPPTATKGKTVTVKDKTGRANGQPIKIVVDGGAKMDSLPAIEIQGMYGSVGFIWDGREWSIY